MKRFFYMGLIFLFVFSMFHHVFGADPLWNIRNIPRSSITVIGHRGAGSLAPDNTLEAMELAWSMGIIPEVDIRTTKDGHLVMFHDNDFSRILPNASPEMKKKGVEKLDYVEVRKLDVGSWRGAKYAGLKVVSLEEIKEALSKDKWRRVYIDVKNVNFGQLAREMEGYHEQLILATGNYNDIKEWRKVAQLSGAMLWMGLGKATDETIEKRFDELRQSNFAGITALQIHVSFLPDGSLQPSRNCLVNAGNELRAHRIEFQTMPWAVKNDKKEYYQQLFNLGSMATGTDRPDIAVAALDEYYTNPPDHTWNVRDHFALKDVIVQAHRGAGKMAPEGSLESFELAWGLGLVPEADLRLTKDNIIVSFHDNDFSRIIPNADPATKKKGIHDLTFEETQKLDIGAYCGEKFKGQKVINLAKILEVLKIHPERSVYVDIKKIDFALLAKQTEGFHSQVIVATTNYDEILAWKKVAPRSKTLHWMGGSEKVLTDRLTKLRKVGFAGIDQLQIHVQIDKNGVLSPSEKFLRETGKELRQHGILFQTLSWTQGDMPQTYFRLLDLGCASFATDYPVETKKAIQQYYGIK